MRLVDVVSIKPEAVESKVSGLFGGSAMNPQRLQFEFRGVSQSGRILVFVRKDNKWWSFQMDPRDELVEVLDFGSTVSMVAKIEDDGPSPQVIRVYLEEVLELD